MLNNTGIERIFVFGLFLLNFLIAGAAFYLFMILVNFLSYSSAGF